MTQNNASEKQRPSILWKLVALPLVLAFLAFIAIGALMPDKADPEGDARLAIKLCWEQQGKKSLTPAAARFAASACEKMETDFEATYKRRP